MMKIRLVLILFLGVVSTVTLSHAQQPASSVQAPADTNTDKVKSPMFQWPSRLKTKAARSQARIPPGICENSSLRLQDPGAAGEDRCGNRDGYAKRL